MPYAAFQNKIAPEPWNTGSHRPPRMDSACHKKLSMKATKQARGALARNCADFVHLNQLPALNAHSSREIGLFGNCLGLLRALARVVRFR